ncbi:MAG: cysteine desulfurase [Lachnospiraceae bacterium]|nr:cysteine desulfurase [Lachnospiraceae bacterium]
MIYLDHAATTPLRREALEAMRPYLTDFFGNASAAYRLGVRSRKALNVARRAIASTIGADPTEIYFTSGATESDNWAIRGAALARMERGRHIITTKIEHPAVLETCRQLERFGFEVTYLDVNRNGVVSTDSLRRAIRPDTVLISVMYANNETGVLQPVGEIGKIAQEHGILFHCDAVQAYGHVPVDPKAAGIDLLSVSGHKFGGPKGVGYLYVRQGIKLEQLLCGGGQESGMRSGTEAVASIAGMAAAAEAACGSLEASAGRVRELREALELGLREAIPGVVIHGGESWSPAAGRNGSGENCRSLAGTDARVENCQPAAGIHGTENRLPGIASIRFPGVEAEQLMIRLDMRRIYVSGGSACSTGSRKPSHVLTAMGVSEQEIRGTLRFSLGEENTMEEILETVKAVKEEWTICAGGR